MVKAVDRAAVIDEVKVLTKSGGRSGTWVRDGSGDAGAGDAR
jgi:molybdenum cofactor biosynthesis enzyme